MVDLSSTIDLRGDDLIVKGISFGSAATSAPYMKVTLTGVNFNSATTDNAVNITLPTGVTTYKVQSVTVWGANHTLTTATAGLFTTAGGTGAICADQAMTNTSGTADTALNMQDLTIASATTAFTDTSLFFRIGTAEGTAATANVTIILRLL